MERKMAPVNVVFHYPKTEEGKRELAERVSKIHGDFVIRRINKRENWPLKLPTFMGKFPRYLFRTGITLFT